MSVANVMAAAAMTASWPIDLEGTVDHATEEKFYATARCPLRRSRHQPLPSPAFGALKSSAAMISAKVQRVDGLNIQPQNRK